MLKPVVTMVTGPTFTVVGCDTSLSRSGVELSATLANTDDPVEAIKAVAAMIELGIALLVSHSNHESYAALVAAHVVSITCPVN